MGDTKENFFICLRALAKLVQHQWYTNKSEQLKTPQGIFVWFVTCLLDQSITPEQHFRVVDGLRKNGWLKYTKLQTLLATEPDKLQNDLREALSSYRFPNKATKAILTNVKKIQKEYEGNLHNIYTFSVEDNLKSADSVIDTLEKISLEVWKRVNNLYWFGPKKAGIFIRELVTQGLWTLTMDAIPIPADSRVRRVLFRLGFVKNRDDLKEVEQAARVLSKEAKITSLDLDCVLWTIGDESICGERKPFCEKCPLDFYCPMCGI